MSKKTSLAAQLEELQASAERLSAYEKLFDRACQMNFGIGAKQIQKLIEKKDKNSNDFESRIRAYYGIKTDAETEDFLTLACTENNLSLFREKRKNASR